MYVAEIFKSIHGEVNGHHQGRVVGFIRLSGCNLHCHYCDTPETINKYYGTHMSIVEIVTKVADLDVQHVCITGGEPLIKIDKLLSLISILHDMGIKISVETNGSLDVYPLFAQVESIIVDYKFEFPRQMKMRNFTRLREMDVIKFVVSSKEEFDRACELCRWWKAEGTEAIFAMSPLETCIKPNELAEWMIESGEHNLLLSLQIHKMLKLK